MAAGTNLVIPEGGVVAAPRKFVAESAIGPKTGAGVQPRVRVYVLRMGKLKDDRPLVLETWEWQQLFSACGRKNGVALHADFFFKILVEIILMAGGALIVPGALQTYRTAFCRYVASVAIESNLLQMKFM